MDGETVFAILVGAALACFSLAMVAYAFFRGNGDQEAQPDAVPAQESGELGLDAIYDCIGTLELEYQLGNVLEEQYRQQLQSYRMQLAAAVKEELDRGVASPELLLEQEVVQARSRASGAWQSCPQCDAPVPEGQRVDGDIAVCPHCGARLGHDSSLAEEPLTPPSSSGPGQPC